MALELHAAGRAGPDVFVVDGVGVLGGDADVAGGEGEGDALGPGLEGGAMRGACDVAEHEGGKVAVFVCEDVEQALCGEKG